MKTPQAPHLDERRKAEFEAELLDRARAWIPDWGLVDGEHDFGRALLEIAARFSSEVAERLDRTGDKMRRGFLDWLGIRRAAARPARLPAVFKLTDAAPEAVLASAPVRMQADAAGTPVVFETESDVRVVPGRLEIVVGVDANADAFYLTPDGLSRLQPLGSLPTQWRLKSFAALGATKLQLDPELGLVDGMIIEAEGRQYKVEKADKDLVTIEPPLIMDLDESTPVTKVTTFSPFGGQAHNWQKHALYLGDSELLNIEAAATIDVVGATGLTTGVTWQYWGKVDGEEIVGWQPLILDDESQNTFDDTVTLTKTKGEIIEREIGGKKSRWIRAFIKTIEPSAAPITAENFSLRINASVCGNDLATCPPTDLTESPKAEAMANSTPLVLDNIFLPLGREPRQFDAFYLGSIEAFSKKGAQVRLCFEMADPTFESLAVVRGTGQFGNRVLAGVGRDHALHLLQFFSPEATISRLFDRDALRPPVPGDSGVVPASAKLLSLNPKCRPVIRTENNDFFVEVASGGTIWIWHENAVDENLSGWKPFLPLPADDPARIDDIVPIVQGSDAPKVVLSNCRLFVHDGTEWLQKVTKKSTGASVSLVALTPVWEDTGSGLDGLNPSAYMVGVSKDNRLYRVTTEGDCISLPLVFDGEDEELVDAGIEPQDSLCNLDAIRPATHKDGDTLTVVTANAARNKLVMYQGDLNSGDVLLVNRVQLPLGDKIVGATVELSFVNSQPQFSVLCETQSGGTYIASWQPSATGNIVKDILFRSNISSLGSLGGAPVMLPGHIVTPGARGDIFVATFKPLQRYELRMPAANPDEDGVVLSSTVNPFVADDVFSLGDRTEAYLVTDALNIPPDPEMLYRVDHPFGNVVNDLELRAYRPNAVPPFNGNIIDSTHLQLNAIDSATDQGTILLIQDDPDLVVRKVVSILDGVAELETALSGFGPADYWPPEAVVGRIAPIIQLEPGISGFWPASILAQARLYFTGTVEPQVQRAKAFALDGIAHPTVIALQLPWVTAPAASVYFVIDSTLGAWQHLLADTSSNAELSWEYSNGTAWESLILEEESTLNFKRTGAVRFRVPNNMKAVDWAGKTNPWIRARLISGDYGREQVTIRTGPVVDGVSEQTVERSSRDIHAPTVVKLHISYGFCDEILPTFLLAEDSGTIRDQSEANRTAGAIVEAFVPLALALGRLSKNITSTDLAAQDCQPDCDSQQQNTIASQAVSTATSAAVASQTDGRALFIGLTRPPSGAPVNILLLVEGRDHSSFAPMTIEALVGDRFVRIIADDTTRALGESGLLSMAFAVPPTTGELFGKSLAWLRLSPKAGTNIVDWKPSLRGAYLNAAWASATETLTRELLGSSDGAPNMIVRLARPPVLRDTLELRVKEPLDEEERKQLYDANPANVVSEVSAVDGRTNHWVLWKQVGDPNDEPSDARVYALDEAKGEIRFGTGLNGMIPPIGRDAIIAFLYKRTEPGPTGSGLVAGNLITARTALNLVSPVATVESVIAADQAVGGAPPEDDERVLRFGYSRLRHRDRAVTLQDLEDLTVESSPDIAQAFAVARQGTVRLVVIMRGKDPTPTTAQRRELRNYLLARAPISLSTTNALRIAGPHIRLLRLDLTLRVTSLDKAGTLGNWVQEQLEHFFDTSTGGIDQDGWLLGSSPSEDDIALALLDAPNLESIQNVKLYEIASDDREQPWPTLLKPHELAMLDKDPLRIFFDTDEEPV